MYCHLFWFTVYSHVCLAGLPCTRSCCICSQLTALPTAKCCYVMAAGLSCFTFDFVDMLIAFSALMQFVGRQEESRACKT